jgi:hypothetical protein
MESFAGEQAGESQSSVEIRQQEDVETIFRDHFGFDFLFEYEHGTLQINNCGQQGVQNIQRLAEILSSNRLYIVSLVFKGNETIRYINVF